MDAGSDIEDLGVSDASSSLCILGTSLRNFRDRHEYPSSVSVAFP